MIFTLPCTFCSSDRCSINILLTSDCPKRVYTSPPKSVLTLNSLPHNEAFDNEAFENTFGKGENAGNQHFLLFPKCFLPPPKLISIY